MSSTAAPRPQHDDPASRRPRRGRAAARLAGVGALALLLSACEGDQSVFDPVGPWAQKADNLWKMVFIIAVVVFIFVQGLIIYASVKFRDKGDDDGKMPVQIHGNTKLELAWTIIPALILAAIAVPTVSLIFDLETDDPDAMVIEVVGHRWWWEYRYPAGEFGEGFTSANELFIPVDTEIRLEMWSEEAGGPANAVIHSYWIPKLNGKKDVTPGRVNTLKLNSPTAGTYIGQCAEYCGLSHANMRQRVVALSAADFDAWVSNQQSVPEIPAEGTAERRGYDRFMTNACIACHAISGSPAQGAVGPNLTHLATRSTFAGAIYDLNTENLINWVRNAPAMKAMHPNASPAIGMPAFLELGDDEIRDIVAYLESLD